VLIERLEHYFSTYKLVPSEPAQIRLAGSYGAAHAHSVVEAAMRDYDELFGARREGLHPRHFLRRARHSAREVVQSAPVSDSIDRQLCD